MGCSCIQCVQTGQHRRAESSVFRPRIILWIGIIDILAGIFYTVFTIRNFLLLHNSYIQDAKRFLWEASSFLGVILRLLMGVALVIGFASKDDKNTKRCCILWMTGQLVFWVESIVKAITAIYVFFYSQVINWSLPYFILLTTTRCAKCVSKTESQDLQPVKQLLHEDVERKLEDFIIEKKF